LFSCLFPFLPCVLFLLLLLTRQFVVLHIHVYIVITPRFSLDGSSGIALDTSLSGGDRDLCYLLCRLSSCIISFFSLLRSSLLLPPFSCHTCPLFCLP
jgi:hypothetical protein